MPGIEYDGERGPSHRSELVALGALVLVVAVAIFGGVTAVLLLLLVAVLVGLAVGFAYAAARKVDDARSAS